MVLVSDCDIGGWCSGVHIFSQLDNTENYPVNMFLFISYFLDFMLGELSDDFWGSNQLFIDLRG